MKQFLFALVILLFSCKSRSVNFADSILADGKMPSVVVDDKKSIHLAYGTGDSLMYAWSSDAGETFSPPALIAVIPNLAASHTRGPQIAATTGGLVLTVCDNPGNIFSFVKTGATDWKTSNRVNDKDTVAKENLMALDADGNTAYSVWLDLRDKHNKIFGSKSIDGGKTWSTNKMIYASPDSTVCECCKPSVVVKGDNVYVMFRNWVDGNRDLYLIQSSDGGTSFKPAEKLGNGSWPLKGCPMDGGYLTVDAQAHVQTVWNRKGKIYSAAPGENEKEIGKGRSCTIASLNGKNVYAWVQDGEIVILNSKGIQSVLGKGQQPVLQAVNNEQVICVWENEKKIHRAIVEM